MVIILSLSPHPSTLTLSGALPFASANETTANATESEAWRTLVNWRWLCLGALGILWPSPCETSQGETCGPVTSTAPTKRIVRHVRRPSQTNLSQLSCQLTVAWTRTVQPLIIESWEMICCSKCPCLEWFVRKQKPSDTGSAQSMGSVHSFQIKQN